MGHNGRREKFSYPTSLLPGMKYIGTEGHIENIDLNFAAYCLNLGRNVVSVHICQDKNCALCSVPDMPPTGKHISKENDRLRFQAPGDMPGLFQVQVKDQLSDET